MSVNHTLRGFADNVLIIRLSTYIPHSVPAREVRLQSSARSSNHFRFTHVLSGRARAQETPGFAPRAERNMLDALRERNVYIGWEFIWGSPHYSL